MPSLNFTESSVKALPPAPAGTRAVYHDAGGRESVAGLSLRVTASGVKTFNIFRRPAGGAPERLSLGRWPAISVDAARRLAKEKIAQLAQGESPNAAKRESRTKGLTVAEAFADYTARKLRGDDKPLKQRTIDDYAAMLQQPRPTAAGRLTKGGALARLADRPIHSLTAAEIISTHEENLKLHSGRQCSYAMQTLKAVCRFHGVKIANSPFDPATPEAQRIRIKKAGVAPREPIKQLSANLGVWWQALPDTPVGDYFRFLALTGCRPGEPLKIRVGDLKAGAITLVDTKNRSDHTLYLSRQALEIVRRQSIGKQPGDKLFGLNAAQANAAAHEISAASGIEFHSKTLRAAFASVAEKLVTFGVLKALMNHKVKNDLLNTNYIEKTENELRAGWQAVADYITQQ